MLKIFIMMMMLRMANTHEENCHFNYEDGNKHEENYQYDDEEGKSKCFFNYDDEEGNTAVEKPDLTRSGCRSADVRRETDLWRKA